MPYINTGSFIIISPEAEFSIFLCTDYLQIPLPPMVQRSDPSSQGAVVAVAPWVSVANNSLPPALGPGEALSVKPVHAGCG